MKRNPLRAIVRISFCSSPLSPIARRAALMRTRQRRIRNDPATPDGGNEIVFADDPLTVADEVNQKVEHLWLDSNGFIAASQFAPAGVKRMIGKGKLHVVAHQWNRETALTE